MIPYQVRLTPTAAGDVGKMTAEEREAVGQGLEELAERPVTLSRPSVAPPFPPNLQMYGFNAGVLSDGLEHRFTVLFRYGQDEQTLFIIYVGHHRHEPDDFLTDEA